MAWLAPATVDPTCPDRGTLVEFDLGKLPAPRHDAIGTHISSCERCQVVLAELQGECPDDDLLSLLRACDWRAPREDDRAWASLAARAEALGAPCPLDTARWSGADDPAHSGEAPVQQIGPYELCGKLGEGGMGVVYRARQVSLERMVALKMILAARHTDHHAVARFHVEGKAIARLRHPNVVQVHDLGEYQGLPYYTMELVEGGSLRGRLARGPLELREAAELVRVLAEAVDYAHREGVVHRDLKPGNILLAKDGTPKIADFGLAKILDAEAGATLSPSLTESGAILGTPQYMAPEQLSASSHDVASATDVYALGAILYELLTGVPPFVAKTKLETFELVRSAPAVAPSRLRPAIPFWLEVVCLKCLNKAPAHRYPSAQALADDLERWLNDERPLGTPSLFRRAGQFSRRHAMTLAAGSALSAMAIGWNLSDPERSLRALERELASGKSVTLIGETGKPGWSRWKCGASKSQVSLAHDGCFSISSFTTCLLELLPDPGSQRYQLTAQVRHERGDPIGEVGLYVGRTAMPGYKPEVHFFTQLGFNAVRSGEAVFNILPDASRTPAPVTNMVTLTPRGLTEDFLRPTVDWRFSSVLGPRFRPLGQDNGQWHSLNIDVTPERVTASWNGRSFFDTTAAINRKVDEEMRILPRPRTSPVPRGFRPVFDGRGGLGLLVYRGYASFRAVRITTL